MAKPTLMFLPGESLEQRAWWAAVHGVTQSWTRLKRFSMHVCMLGARVGSGNKRMNKVQSSP